MTYRRLSRRKIATIESESVHYIFSHNSLCRAELSGKQILSKGILVATAPRCDHANPTKRLAGFSNPVDVIYLLLCVVFLAY